MSIIYKGAYPKVYELCDRLLLLLLPQIMFCSKLTGGIFELPPERVYRFPSCDKDFHGSGGCVCVVR